MNGGLTGSRLAALLFKDGPPDQRQRVGRIQFVPAGQHLQRPLNVLAAIVQGRRPVVAGQAARHQLQQHADAAQRSVEVARLLLLQASVPAENAGRARHTLPPVPRESTGAGRSVSLEISILGLLKIPALLREERLGGRPLPESAAEKVAVVLALEAVAHRRLTVQPGVLGRDGVGVFGGETVVSGDAIQTITSKMAVVANQVVPAAPTGAVTAAPVAAASAPASPDLTMTGTAHADGLSSAPAPPPSATATGTVAPKLPGQGEAPAIGADAVAPPTGAGVASEVSRGASNGELDLAVPRPPAVVLYDWVTASALWLAVGAVLLTQLVSARALHPTTSRDAPLALTLSALPYAGAYLIIGVATELRYLLWSLMAISVATVIRLSTPRSA